MRSFITLLLTVVLVPTLSSAEFEEPVTGIKAGLISGRFKSDEIPQEDFLAYWTIKSSRREEGNWIKLSPVNGGRNLSFHYGNKPRFFEEIRPYDRNLRTEDFAGVVGQFGGGRHPTEADNVLMKGLFAVIERVREGEEADCPQYSWWMPTQMMFATGKNALEFAGSINGKKIEKDAITRECKLGGADQIDLTLVRHKGVTFNRAFAGRYIYTLTVGAPSHFAGLVEVGWDYTALVDPTGGIGGVRISIGKGSAEPERQLIQQAGVSGTYQFKFISQGVYFLNVEVLGRQNEKLFTDQLILQVSR